MNEALILTDDEFDLSSAIWELIQATGHLECGGWTHDSRDPDRWVFCACGYAIPMPERSTS